MNWLPGPRVRTMTHGRVVHAGHRAERVFGRSAHRLTHAGRKTGEDLHRIAKGEIVEHDHDFLLVEAGLGRIVNNERSGEQLLLLQPDMRVHPVRAGPRQQEVIVITRARP